MKRKIVIPILLAFMAVGLGGFMVSKVVPSKGYSNESSWSDVSYKEKYNYHDVLNIQERTFTKDGTTYPTSYITTFPDGSKSEKSSISLDQIGNYVISYTSLVDDQLYSKNANFNVSYGPYYFDTVKSSLTYGTTERASTSGLIIDLAKDDTFHLTQHINVNGLTKSDLLVKGYIAPSILGTTDFTALTFKFYDSVDPSIYLECSYFAYEINSQGGWSFAGAGGNGQEICGWLASKGEVYRGSGTGASMMTSFSGVRRDTLQVPNTYQELQYDAYPFQVSIDMKDLTVYGYNNTLICDLDSSVFFEKFWTGFPSGKADLTVSAGGYSGSSGRVVLTEILGCDDLSKLRFEDTVGPVITVDTPYETLPSGVVDKAYKVPSATAFDDYSRDCEVKTEVIYNFAGANPTNVSLVNNMFTPNKSGPYAIRYSSTDESNNTTYLLKTVNVYPSLDPITFNLPSEKVTSCEVGEVITLKEPTNLKGGSGNKEYCIIASLNEHVVEIIDNKFIPDDIGNWEITYIVRDYIDQEVRQSYNLNVTMTNDYSLNGMPSFLSHYVSGCEYEMPLVKLFHKVNNSVEVIAGDVIVSDVNGDMLVHSLTNFIPHGKNNGDAITFKIIMSGLHLLEVKTKAIIPFVEKENEHGLVYDSLCITNYFEGNGYDISGKDALTSAGLKFTTTSGYGETSFLNPLKNDDVTISLYRIYSRNTSAEIDFVLRDCYDESKTLTIKAITEGLTLRYVYGDQSMEGEYSFTNPDMNNLLFNFDGKNILINSFVCKVTTFDNGLPFTGFENKVIPSIKFKSFNNNDYFYLRNINNHTVNDGISDKASPIISLLDRHSIEHEINEVYRIPKAYSYDVLSPNVDLLVTVVDENKNYVTALDGTLLKNAPYKDDYIIILSEFGQYHLTYSSYESTTFMSQGNLATLQIYISVLDREAPTLTITSDYTKEAKVGEYIIVPNYEVSDNCSDKDRIHKIVTVTDPSGKTYFLDNVCEVNREKDLSGNPIPPTNAFKVAQAGIHIVTIMIMDEAGNSTSFIYQVEAKEAK